MAQLKAARVADVPTLDVVAPGLVVAAAAAGRRGPRGRFLVIGHRGKGMNALASADRRLQEVRENTVRSFNDAARFAADYVEFDVQVTKDGCPIIFHDNFIFTEEDGKISQRRVTDLQLEDFLQYGPQNEQGKTGKPLLRKMKDGRMLNWNVQSDDALCTLQEAFEKVNPRLGFNVELKFDDSLEYQEEELTRILQAILKVIFEYAKDRPILFSSFQPDAAQLTRKLQSKYPVYFLTNGGTEIYTDVRRNSLEEAIKLCLASGLQGIVSEARGIFRHPAAIPKIKEANLSLLTYGTLNNVPEAVYMQHLMGVNGVIVDLVPEITKAVSELIAVPEPDPEVEDLSNQAARGGATPNFSQREISFLLRLIPELVR
ncbi:glycerophosphodiester phosphodiesterase GDPD1, chloroplastic-like [Phragmites australis]|uniref:glycerophosphodiester phosphodiesterase GDPD1, chloroplastic-like n=1 Tax=Phragmites australis TaxID=29695 RepID=UPI002D78529E|nr:glycerophosphodiester phosphodiesterase GDPD1, chloroplastic-like [Phragmites australis]